MATKVKKIKKFLKGDQQKIYNATIRALVTNKVLNVSALAAIFDLSPSKICRDSSEISRELYGGTVRFVGGFDERKDETMKIYNKVVASLDNSNVSSNDDAVEKQPAKKEVEIKKTVLASTILEALGIEYKDLSGGSNSSEVIVSAENIGNPQKFLDLKVKAGNDLTVVGCPALELIQRCYAAKIHLEIIDGNNRMDMFPDIPRKSVALDKRIEYCKKRKGLNQLIYAGSLSTEDLADIDGDIYTVTIRDEQFNCSILVTTDINIGIKVLTYLVNMIDKLGNEEKIDYYLDKKSDNQEWTQLAKLTSKHYDDMLD